MKKTIIANGSAVEFKGQAGHVTHNEKGWYDVTLDNGEFVKARAKDLTVLVHGATLELPDPEERCEGCGNRNRSCTCGQALEPAQAISEQPAEDPGHVNTDKIELHCAACGHAWTPKRLKLSMQCPKCGAWVMVKIRADLSHYIRGLSTTPSGHDTLDIGDATADKLRGLTTEDIINVTAAELYTCGEKAMSKLFRKDFKKLAGGVWDLDTIASYLSAKYFDRNNGMVRMNCGNLIRSAYNRMHLK